MKSRLTLPSSRHAWAFDLLDGRLTAPVVLVVGLALLTIDTLVILRAFVSDPWWRNSIDFSVYIEAAEAIMRGGNPYDWSRYSTVPFNGYEIRHLYPYPPLFAELIAPLLVAGDNVARATWLVLNIGFIAVSVTVLLRHFGTRVPWHWLILGVAVVGASRVFRLDVLHGQANFLLLCLLLVGLLLYLRGHQFPAGFVLGLMFVIKPFMGILLPYFLWRRSWVAAITSGLTGAVVLAISFIPLLHTPQATIGGWLATMSYYSGPVRSSDPDNQSFHGLFLRLFATNPYTIPWVDSPTILLLLHLVFGALLVGLFVLAVPSKALSTRQRQRQPALLLAESGLAIGLGMTFGPFTEGDHLFLMVPGLMGVLFLARHYAQVSLWRWAAVAWIAIFLPKLSPIELQIFRPSAKAHGWEALQGAAVLLTGWESSIMLAAMVLLAVVLWRQRSTLAEHAGEPSCERSALLPHWTTQHSS